MPIWAIISILYVLVGMLSFRPVAGHFAYKKMNRDHERYPTLYPRKKTEPTEWSDAYFAAFWLAWVWPVFIINAISAKFIPAVGAEKQHRLEAEIEARKARDKELGLEPYEYGKIGS